VAHSDADEQEETILQSLKSWALSAFIALSAMANAQTNLPATGKALLGLEAFDEVMLATLAKNDYTGGT
jgi:hypothetical protein